MNYYVWIYFKIIQLWERGSKRWNIIGYQLTTLDAEYLGVYYAIVSNIGNICNFPQ